MLLAPTPRLAARATPCRRARQPPRCLRAAAVKGDDKKPHFEMSPPAGECLLEDARDAMEACAKKVGKGGGLRKKILTLSCRWDGRPARRVDVVLARLRVVG